MPNVRLKLRTLKRRLKPTKRVMTTARKKMNNFGIGSFRSLIVLPVLFVMILIAVLIKLPAKTEHIYMPQEDLQAKPNAGIAIDASADPDSTPDYITLAYVHVTWRELEPTEGEYLFEDFEQRFHINEWRSRNVKLVWHLSLDEPGNESEFDIPLWLYEKTSDGVFYEYNGQVNYAPDYSNLDLQDAHMRLLQAIAQRYSEDIAYVEMGSLGIYGNCENVEGINNLPMLDVISTFIRQYNSVFPSECVLTSKPYRESGLLANGAYLSCLGNAEETWEWIDLYTYGGWDEDTGADFRSQKDFGRLTVVGCSLNTSVVANISSDSIERMLNACRATYICVGSESTESYAVLQKQVGYDLWVRHAEWNTNVRRNYSVYVDLTMRNDGSAPLFGEWEMYIGLYNGSEIVYSEIIDADITECYPGETDIRVHITIPYDMDPGRYQLAVTVIDTNSKEISIPFSMQTKTYDNWYMLGEVLVY